MPDMCAFEPEHECRGIQKYAILEKRVSDIEKGQEREEDFRKVYYREREERAVRDAKLDGRIESMDTKLDKVVAYQEAQQAKPGGLMDKLKDRAVEYIMLALLAILLFRLGIPT